MGKALQAYRRYRELADHGEFHRLAEVLDEDWIENCLGLTGWTRGLDIALANRRMTRQATAIRRGGRRGLAADGAGPGSRALRPRGAPVRTTA